MALNEPLYNFLNTIKKDEIVMFILVSGVVGGKFIKYDTEERCVHISVKIIGNTPFEVKLLIIPILNILAWGKQ